MQPIAKQQQEQVCRATDACLRQAGKIYHYDFTPVPVRFDLRGRAAGMYRVQHGQRHIRYNPYIFSKYFDDSLVTTVPHEVAHYVTDMLYGLRNIRPHGVEWQEVMRSLGAEPRVTGQYDLQDLPVRRQRRFTYRCDCTTHLLSTCRHNRVHRGKAVYHCRRCGMALARTSHGVAR